MNKEQIKKRIEYLEMELAHRGFWDGWCIQGMEKELSELKKSIDSNNKNVLN
tara:strand:- start:151 stop:306 length:156 start_codon:yes stop_codon:yes gene_type:complete